MKREYNSGTSEEVTFFVGNEIEKTPAQGMRTLFVVGLHKPEIIINLIDQNYSAFVDTSKNIKHIYFGANMSFNPTGMSDVGTWHSWREMIYQCLNAGYWCTLDLDVKDVEGLIGSGLAVSPRFIPQISVKLPYLQQLGYNATIKLDDKDFNASNPGVWCHTLNSLTTRETFTDWDQYGKDEILK